jgi:hypothetical protein
MLRQEKDAELLSDLEQRIDAMQNMGDAELGTFGRLDWLTLILISIVIPVIVVILAR